MNKSGFEMRVEERLKLIEWATDKAAEGIVITDARLPDNPIIYANLGFLRMTGYDRGSIIGKNCRFLQGENTDTSAVDKIRNAISDHEPCVVELLNYRKDGTPFWNRLSITPLFNEHGDVTHFVGVQSDITELKATRDKLEQSNYSLTSFYNKVTAELRKAKQAMESILPQQLPLSKCFRIATRFKPLREIGGDFFDVFRINESVYGILIADVTGHGIPAAILSYMSLSTFKKTAVDVLSTRRVMETVNQSLYNTLPDGNFISMFYMIYNEETRELTFTQAGHPPALLMRNHPHEIIALSTENILVGLFPNDQVTFTETTIVLNPGDKLLLYTDAITEAGRRNDHSMTLEKLADFLSRHSSLEIRELIQSIYEYGLRISQRPEYDDDVTLICFEITA